MSVSNDVKAKLISEFIGTQAGRHKLAASMTQPLRMRRDYMAVGRKTFLVEQLPDGALPIYDKDPDVTAYVVGEEGENILAITRCRNQMNIKAFFFCFYSNRQSMRKEKLNRKNKK